MKRALLIILVIFLTAALIAVSGLVVFTLITNGESAETMQVATMPTVAPTEATTPPTEPTTAPTEATTVPTEPQPEVFTLTFVGDCTLGADPTSLYSPNGFIKVIGENYDYPFANVIDYFKNDDFTMINLEGVLGNRGAPANKTFTFRGPAEYINILTRGSVEAVTLANNHAYDYYTPGYEGTTDILTEAGIPYVERNSSTLVTTESGLTIGLYAALFTIEQDDLEAEVAAMREQGADVVVFAIHWGSEGYYYPLSHQIQQAYDAIDAGVDIVYGHHPHVLQKIEEYNGGIIYYSLGNFSFGGNLQPRDMDTVLLQQQVIRELDGTVHLGELTIVPCSVSSIEVYNNFQPTPYEEGSEEYERVLTKLAGEYKGPNLNTSY